MYNLITVIVIMVCSFLVGALLGTFVAAMCAASSLDDIRRELSEESSKSTENLEE